MKSKLLLTSALAAAIAAPAFAGSFTLEGLALTRDDYTGTLLATDSAPAPDTFLFADDLDVKWTGGARATYENEFWGHNWQLSAFFVVPSSDSVLFGPSSDDIDLSYTFDPGATIDTTDNSQEAVIVAAQSEWEAWGAEFNWVKKLAGKLNLIVGARYINFSENLNTTTDDDNDDFTGDRDFVQLSTNNDLVGLQVGLEGDWNLSSNVMIGGSLKGGIAANFVSRDRSFTDTDGASIPFADSINDTGFAQFAEFNPRLTVALSDSASLVVGGNVLWLNEVAEAAPHFPTAGNSNDLTNLRDDEDVLLYGATIGLKLALN
jgi:hypothetical protein